MSDKIEIVRCKHCIHAKKINGWFIVCKLHDIRPTPLVMDDWYCPDGKENEMEIKIVYKNGDEFICNFPEDIIGEALASVFDNAKCVSGKVCKDGKEQSDE